ncbi:Gfo/Idh/MocA family oxidoreductase [uncultured Helicobacter sp.]|uniref:Gfo/Idh/MocA family oxidoreductase n=1 Tax=uncultured Helicobacter sp. TaxID=175537 RepID=UPI00374F1D54
MSHFVLIGAAGFVAPRHLRAIRDTHNFLYAAIDTSDCVGVLDSYFPETRFFLSLESFQAHKPAHPIDYMSICTPNFCHKQHIEFALTHDMHAICEKPIVLRTAHVLELLKLERDSGKSISTILQLRLHPAIIALREAIYSRLRVDPTHIFEVDLSYISVRGQWYFLSWKGDDHKSGGLACNIGIHLFDMLCFLFGECQENIVHYKSPSTICGFLTLTNARVRWILSIDRALLPSDVVLQGRSTYRVMCVDGQEVEFTHGFEDLHTKSYEEILSHRGFGLESALPSLEIIERIGQLDPIGLKGEYHPLAKALA